MGTKDFHSFQEQHQAPARGSYFMGKKKLQNKQNWLYDYLSSGLGNKLISFFSSGWSPQETKEAVIKGEAVPLIFQEAGRW